jgi:Ricin-type beta-trefoil lectin domain-like
VKRVHDQILLLGIISLSLALVLATIPPPALAQTATQAGSGGGKSAKSSTQAAQEKEDTDKDDNFNSPPFDFSDAFYKANGVDFEKLNTEGQRFGFEKNRLTGPPAGPGQVNWKIDNSNNDPDRKNVRILASTGGYKDDTGSPTQFISIIAFLNDRTFFTPENRLIPPGTGNARGVTTEGIAGNFEAYVGLRQVGPGGVFRPTPCASIGDPVQVAAHNCFSVASVATPHLRQDWRFSTNRNAIDASAPLSYFGDNLVGLWIITYFWYTDAGFGPRQTPDCKAALDFLAARNGLTLDGTPVIKTGAELHFVEGALVGNEVNAFPPPPTNACAMENNLDRDGKDKGAVWLICPSIPDPRQGGIAPDAFVDTVRRPNGVPVDPNISAEFNCLQKNGTFCALRDGTYHVYNQTGDVFWDGAGNSTVQLNPLNVGSTGASQLWTFTANADGTYRIVNKVTGRLLSAPPGSRVSGAALVQVKSDNDTDERWFVTALNNGFRITNASTRLAIDATNPSPNPGTSIVQATPTGETEQVWVIN